MYSRENPLPAALPNQNGDGVDLARLRANLRLTPTERVEKAQAAAWLLYHLKNAAYASGLRRAD